MSDRSQLFTDIDSMDPDRFAAHLADDIVMRFGNGEPIEGRSAVRDGEIADYRIFIDLAPLFT